MYLVPAISKVGRDASHRCLGLFYLWIGLELRFSVKLRSILWLRLAVVAAYRLLSADMLIATIAPMK